MRDLLAYVVETEKLLWTLRFLRLRLACLRMQLWLKEATRNRPNRDFSPDRPSGEASSIGGSKCLKPRFGQVRRSGRA